MTNPHLLNTNGVLKVFDMPVEPIEIRTDPTYPVWESFDESVETAKAAAAIDVVNPEVLVSSGKFVVLSDGLYSVTPGGGNLRFLPGESLRVPDSLGVEIVKQGKFARIIQKT